MLPRGAPPAAAGQAAFCAGRIVRLKGLQDDLELNGKLCLLMDYDTRRERWLARMESGERVAVRAENLAAEDAADSGDSAEETEANGPADDDDDDPMDTSSDPDLDEDLDEDFGDDDATYGPPATT